MAAIEVDVLTGEIQVLDFTAVQEALSLSLEQVAQLGRNAFLSSFLEDREKAAALAKLEHCVELFRNAAWRDKSSVSSG